MGRVAGEHGPAARLGNIADQQTWPAIDVGDLAGEIGQEGYQDRMAPGAVAGWPHHLPGRSVGRQRDASREAALGIGPDHPCLERRRGAGGPERLLGDRIIHGAGGTGRVGGQPRHRHPDQEAERTR